MANPYPYRATIRNEYLGVSKEICARTCDEFEWRKANQRTKWNAQEAKKRQSDTARREVEDLRLRAEELTQEAQARLESFRSILNHGALAVLVVRWDELLDRRLPPNAPTFSFDLPKPDLNRIRLETLGLPPTEDVVRSEFGVPDERPFVEMILPFLRSRRRRAEEEAAEEFRRLSLSYRSGEKRAIAAYNERVREYNSRRREAKIQFAVRLAAHEKEDEAFRSEQERHNAAVTAFKTGYESGAPVAIERLAQMVLDRSAYPDGIAGDPDVLFDEPSRILVLNFWLPNPSQIPSILEHKFVAARKEIRQVEMKKADFQSVYDDIINQIALRTIHEVFSTDYANHIQAVVFNGWIRGLNPETGKEFTSCILSCQAPRDKFREIDLTRASPRDCVRGLRGITAGPLAELAPVRPIMDINRDDDRFVESKEVMGHLDPRENLAAMDWEDFEHLVRDLFARVFEKDGCEVKVTQASRDRGVDAIAFDPDPVRGGKFVIQAKRYNMVVPVSAVRELFGTMIAEGANKGILVTTSRFGHDSREFAKNRPITLIDGPNLVHMFQEHGQSVYIALAPRGDRPGIGRSISRQTPNEKEVEDA
jgi:restriction system protein